MSGWFANAKKHFTRTVPDEPVPFALRCGCNHAVTGMRSEFEQAMRCSDCGSLMFILPRNIYPEPKPRRKTSPVQSTKVAAPRPKSSQAGDTARRVVDGTVPVAPVRKNREEKRAIRAKQLEAAKQAAAANATQTAAQSSLETIQQTLESTEYSTTVERSPVLSFPVQSIRSWFSGFRAVLLGATMIVVLTIYWQWRSNQHEQAQLQLSRSIESGQKALADSDFITANIEFQQVADSLRVLGRSDIQARSWQQMALELNIMEQGLSNAPLADIVSEAIVLRSARRAKPDLKKQKQKGGEKQAKLDDDGAFGFSPLYASQWLVFDTWVDAEYMLTRKNHLTFEYPLQVRGKTVSVTVSPEKFQVEKPTGGELRLVFAAQLESCRENEGRWVVELQPESAFLWTNMETCAGLGLVPFDQQEIAAFKDVIDQQAAKMGVSYAK